VSGLIIGLIVTNVGLPAHAQDDRPAASGPPTRAEFSKLQADVKEQRDLIIQMLQTEQQRYDMLLRLLSGQGGGAPLVTLPAAPDLPGAAVADSAPRRSAGAAHVVRYGTSTAITSHAPSPSNPGQAITVGYSVTPTAAGGPAPTGNVTVSDGAATCTGTVAAGSCAITLNNSGNSFGTLTVLTHGTDSTSLTDSTGVTVASAAVGGTLTLAAGGPDQPEQHPDRGRLARPVGADEPTN